MQWSTQPIYVLDKDNDLDLHDLAHQNAADIVAIQPEGPYLLGGHSYGGAVAMEIAMVLESWGKEVGLVLVCFIYISTISMYYTIFIHVYGCILLYTIYLTTLLLPLTKI